MRTPHTARRTAALLIVVVLLVAVTMRHPSADIRILTHDSADRSPVRVQAAFDLGLVAVSVLVTWTKRLV
jgi:uncharacterized membrane protein YphA (DoxX/SURF4 family)